MTEKCLADKFIDHYSKDYEIFKEVNVGGTYVDLVLRKGIITIAIEVKTTFSVKVIEQAYNNKSCFNYTYVGVPETKNSFFQEFICRNFGIGVIRCDKYGGFREAVLPVLNRKPYKVELHNYQKNAVAGTQHGKITPFRNTVNEIVKRLERYPDGLHMNDLFSESSFFHWSTLSAAKSALYQWIKAGVITEFYINKGKLFLNKNI